MLREQYGRYSLEHLKRIVDLIHERKTILNGIYTLISTDTEKFWSHFTPGYYWGHLYENSFEVHLSVLLKLGGLDSWMETAAKSSSPVDSILIEDFSLSETIGSSFGIDKDQLQKYRFFTLYSIMKNAESISHFGVPLNNLVARVRQGHDSSLFDIVSIDRSSLVCPSIADRVSRAEIEQDRKFFNKLQKALKGPSAHRMVAHGPLRYLLYVLVEDGVLDDLSSNELFSLLCQELELYPYKDGGGQKSLIQFISRWKKGIST
jgi:hypothetical protein